MVLSLAYVFTTRADAATPTYKYILYDNSTGALLVSNSKLIMGYQTVNKIVQANGSLTTPLTGYNRCIYQGDYIDTFLLIPVNTTTENISTYDVYKGSYVLNNANDEITIAYYYGVDNNTNYIANPYFRGTIKGNYKPSGYSGSVGSLPDNIGGEPVEDIIDRVLNSTTNVSTKANTYVTNITNVYNLYKSGGVTLEQAKEEVNNNLEDLKDISQTPTATLKDAVNITNALTYGQTVNDTLLQEQEEKFWETRDIGNETSANAQISDQEEIDYLNTLIAETTEKISDLSPSEDFTPEQISTTTEIIEGIWENPIISKIIPLAACFMVICVALGIRYKL